MNKEQRTDEEVQLLVYRYSIGELTEVQFNYYVQMWNLDREYVQLLLQDFEQGKQIAGQAQIGCIVLVMLLGLAFLMYIILGIS